MNMATIVVSGVYASARMYSTIPAGIVGATVTFEFTDPIWEGLTKTAVFQGAVTRDVIMTGSTAIIPAETVAKAGPMLKAGIYGVDAENNLVIPTLWAAIGGIRDAADPSGDPGTDPELPIWAQLADRVEGIAKDVEELQQTGGVGPGTPGKPGTDGEDGGYYTPAVTQLDEDTVQFEFTPSKPDMPAVNPVTVELPAGQGSGGNVDLTGYATEEYVQDYAQPKGEYLTEVPSGYATEEFVRSKIAEAELGGEEVDLSGYAQKSELPTKVSQLENDKGYLTEHQSLDGYAKTEDIPKSPSDIGAQPVGNYALKSEIPSVPVQAVNGKTGAVSLSASDVKARPDTWMPTAQEVGALPNTYTPPNQTAEQVGADPTGTAASAVSQHNTADDSHGDIRLELKAISDRLTAFFDSDNQTLDELSEIVAYITSNKSLIDSITTSKVSVADIVNNLTSNVTNKPLSAAQGVVLKGLIDAVSNSLANYQPKGDYALRSELPNVPTKLSEFTNDSGFITGYTETDPTVPSWAKASSKPSYSKSEVGLGNVDNVKQYSANNPPPYPVNSVNGKTGAVTLDIPTVPTKVSAFENDKGYLTQHQDISGLAKKFDPTVYRLPILYLTGSTTGMTKDNEVTLSYKCNDKNGTAKTGSCTMKWQGSSSLAWDKKNYTIKFDNAFEVVDGWGSQKKYCLKANWIDHSHSRNVVSAKLWGLIRKNRSNLNSKLKALPNAGAIDGFPVIIMLNGEFHGLYSFNIPKDAWMFGMGSGTKEAIVTADNQATDTAFKGETLLDAEGLELEYNSSGFSATAVKDSFNTLINACINSFGGDLDTEVAKYLDWESAIDYYIFTVIIKGGDMIQKNAIYATFDGVKWYFSAYDMDTTYGLAFDGSALDRAVSNVTFVEAAESHRVFELIKRFKTNELKARYNELRANALSETRICQYFENYAWDISSPILVEEVKRWPSVRGSSVNGIDQICRWVRQRLEVTDKWINDLPAQETPVEPEQPVEMVNQVPISTDTDGSIYNGTGYKDDARLSSSGGVSGTAQSGSVVTGFIPCKNTDVIRIKGAQWLGMSAANSGTHWYINFYKSDKSFVEGINDAGYAANKAPMTITYDSTTGVTTFDVNEGGVFANAIANAAYFRINAYGKGADLIVTVNQEITT